MAVTALTANWLARTAGGDAGCPHAMFRFEPWAASRFRQPPVPLLRPRRR